jgi:hypothetical protein
MDGNDRERSASGTFRVQTGRCRNEIAQLANARPTRHEARVSQKRVGRYAVVPQARDDLERLAKVERVSDVDCHAP